MIRRIRNPLILMAIIAIPVQAELKLGQDASVVFATVEQGTKILTSSDDFVQRMSPFDRAARVQSDRDTDESTYLKYVGARVLAWNPNETKEIESAIAEIQSQLNALSVPLSGTIFMIKTTGKEEGDAWSKWREAGLSDLLGALTPMEFMLRFTASHREIDTIIVGTADPAHLKTNVDALLQGPLPSDVYEETLARLAKVGEQPAGGRRARPGLT